MKMNVSKIRDLLIERLQSDRRNISYDEKNNQLRIEVKEINQGINISLPTVLSKWEEKENQAIDEVVYYVDEALDGMVKTKTLAGNEKNILPVIRSTSFPIETKDGKKLIFDDHTAETRVFYALDLGTSYRLIDQTFVQNEGWNEEEIKEISRFNVRSLNVKMKKDEVAGNSFYFLNSNDGYDASRILNDSLLEKMTSEIKGTMIVAIPHHDVLIIGDIQNDHGYNILSQMTMQFFTEGRVPITALPFLYENKELEPIFVFTQNKQTE